MRSDERPSRQEMERLLADLQARAGRANARHRASRALSVTLSIALVGLALVWSMGSLLGLRGDGASPAASPPASAETNYVVEFLGFDTAGETPPGKVLAHIRYSWASDSFPGIRDCELTALDEQGGTVGRFTTQVTVLDPADPLDGILEMPVQGQASTVRGTCGPRLDIGEPYEYALDQMFVWVSGNGGVTLSLQAKWLGEGVPGIVDCRFTLVDTHGGVVATHTDLEPPTPGQLPFLEVQFQPEDILGPLPTQERDIVPYVSCVPYVNGSDAFPPFDPPVLQDAVAFDYTSPTGMGWTFSDVVFHPSTDGWETDFRMTWEDGVFPGVRPCTVTLTGTSGEVIKTERFQYEGLGPVADRAVVTSEQPAGFDASCGERADTPVAYVISAPTTVWTGDQVGIRFTVGWPDGLAQGAYPGTNQCVAALVSPSNAVLLVKPFTLSVPPGGYDTALGVDRAAAEDATPVIRCEPFQGDLAAMLDRVVQELGAP